MLLLLSVGCGSPECVDTVLMECPSPANSIVAVVFERDCGATTAKNIQICFRKAEETFDTKKECSFVIFESEALPKLEWRGSNKLIVIFPAERKIFRQETIDSKIAIEYADSSR